MKPSRLFFPARGTIDQAAFMGVGLPGILLSIITFIFIKEPIRGMSEGIITEPSKEPFKDTFKEFIGLTPLSFIGRQDLARTLLINLIIASTIFLVCFLLYLLTEDFLQWVAWGIGAYLVCTWIQSLRERDPVAFNLMFRSKAIVYSFISFPCIPFVGYAYSAFTPPFYINYHGMTALEIGTKGWIMNDGVKGLKIRIRGLVNLTNTLIKKN